MANGMTHLFVPGPTNVPEVVRRALNVPMEDHRAPDFPDLTSGLFRDLKLLLRNETGRVFVYPSSGTGAWEAAISNTLDRGDRVLMSRFGQFSHFWVDMARRLGLDVVCIDVEWGAGVPLDEYDASSRPTRASRRSSPRTTRPRERRGRPTPAHHADHGTEEAAVAA
jgi:alanine-glyoxylate transaminase / serine-glyoxylate transaminase / serine-pyruvate transaminase